MRLSPDTPPLKKPIPRDAFKAEVAAWAQKIQVTPREVHVRPMVHKWGSASTTGRVSFSTDLLRQHPDFRNRVIVEELLHLKVPSHGKLFKSLLKACLG